jgi:hypothetical protein
MKTLFNKEVNDGIITRIEKVNPSLKAKWGKMNAAKMLAHLRLSFEANFGEIVLNRDLVLSTVLRPLAKRILLGNRPFWKNMPTDKKLIPKDPVDFFEEQQKVIEMIKKYITVGPDIISKNPHNILGKITPEQSAFISYKHVDHHLRQFGIEAI